MLAWKRNMICRVLVMTLSTLILGGCAEDHEQMLLRRDYSELQIQYDKLMDEKEALDLEKIGMLLQINETGEKYRKAVEENRTLKTENESLQDKNAYAMNLLNDASFDWMSRTGWDSVEVEAYGVKINLEETREKAVQPASFIGAFSRGFEPEAMPEGFGRYRFTGNGETHVIEIFRDHLFRYDDVFYKCEGNAACLVEAMLPARADWLAANNLLEHIYNSTAVLTEDLIFPPQEQVQSLALLLGRLEKVEKPAEDKVGKLNHSTSFYWQGNIVVADFYDKYVRLRYDKQEEWLETGEYGPISGLFNAG